MHTTPLDTLEPAAPSRRAQAREITCSDGGTALASTGGMMRTVMLALACVLVAAAPAAAKKRHGHAHAAKAKRSKRPKPLVRGHHVAPPRFAAAEEHPTPAPLVSTPPPTPTPTPTPAPPPAAEPAPTVDRGPMGPQASDDEVPGSRMKR